MHSGSVFENLIGVSYISALLGHASGVDFSPLVPVVAARTVVVRFGHLVLVNTLVLLMRSVFAHRSGRPLYALKMSLSSSCLLVLRAWQS